MELLNPLNSTEMISHEALRLATILVSFCENNSSEKNLVTLDCYIQAWGLTKLNVCSSDVHRQISI